MRGLRRARCPVALACGPAADRRSSRTATARQREPRSTTTVISSTPCTGEVTITRRTRGWRPAAPRARPPRALVLRQHRPELADALARLLRRPRGQLAGRPRARQRLAQDLGELAWPGAGDRGRPRGRRAAIPGRRRGRLRLTSCRRLRTGQESRRRTAARPQAPTKATMAWASGNGLRTTGYRGSGLGCPVHLAWLSSTSHR